MQAMLDHDQRHRGHRGESRLPVLFHLMDISRPRQPAEQAATAGQAPQAEPAMPDSNLEIASEDKEVTPPPERPIAVGAELEQAIQPPASSQSPPIGPDISATAPEVEANSRTVSAAADPPTRAAEPAIISEPMMRPAAPNASPTERSIRRKAKRPASEDWFASHGKFIAIAFVLALLGTIYFARTNRRQSVAGTDTTLASTERTEQGQKGYDSRPVDRTSGHRLTSTSTGESGTAQTGAAADGNPMTELLPPTTPPLASDGSSGDKSPKSDNLFVFPAKKGDDRMAVRPETATNPTSAIQNATPVQATSPVEPPSGGATSELAPAYPTTSQPAAPRASSLPAGAYPVTGAPPLGAAAAPSPPAMSPTNQAPGAASATYVPANYRSQYPAATGFTPPAAQAWSPSAAAAGAPSPYQPSDTTARGPRYERTGSGNY